MLIAVDGQTTLQQRIKAGTFIDAFDIIRNVIPLDAANKYVIYLSKYGNPVGDDHLPNITTGNLQYKKIYCPHYSFLGRDILFLFWRTISLPLSLIINPPDIFYSPTPLLPPYTPCNTIVKVHDLAYLKDPSFYSKIQRLDIFNTGFAIRHATRIIAISNSTKNDIISEFKIEDEKISVIYRSYDNSTFKPDITYEDKTYIKRKFNISDDYILYVGTLEPRKNIPRLLEAFSYLIKYHCCSLNLVLVGEKGWLYDQIYNKVNQLNINKQVIFTDYVVENDLVLLMRAARILVYPSLYEGFGLPPLQAMACGTPVITSNVSSMPEVVGEAAILINPYSVSELANAIYSVITDNELAAALSRKGIERATLFSADREAAQIIDLFNTMGSSSQIKRNRKP